MQQTVTGKIQWVIVQSILGHVDQGCEPPPPKWPSPSTDVALNGALSRDIEKTPSSLYWVLIYAAILKLKLDLQLLTWEPPPHPRWVFGQLLRCTQQSHHIVPFPLPSGNLGPCPKTAAPGGRHLSDQQSTEVSPVDVSQLTLLGF